MNEWLMLCFNVLVLTSLSVDWQWTLSRCYQCKLTCKHKKLISGQYQENWGWKHWKNPMLLLHCFFSILNDF